MTMQAAENRLALTQRLPGPYRLKPWCPRCQRMFHLDYGCCPICAKSLPYREPLRAIGPIFWRTWVWPTEGDTRRALGVWESIRWVVGVIAGWGRR